MLRNAWIIPFIPAMSFVLILLIGKRTPGKGHWIGIAAVSASFVLASIAGVQWIQHVNDAHHAASSEEQALSVGGAVLAVRAVEASAVGTVYLLERASDGGQVSVDVVGSGVAGSAYAVGTVVTCSVIGTGVILSAAGEAIAFVPNAIGRALLHNERL